MEIDDLKELNYKIIKESMAKVDKAVNNKSWDKECFETMSQSIDNLLDLTKIERYSNDREVKEYRELKGKLNAEETETEFETLIYKISEKSPKIETMLAITTILADHMEDMRILNKRAYDIVMMKLKELL